MICQGLRSNLSPFALSSCDSCVYVCSGVYNYLILTHGHTRLRANAALSRRNHNAYMSLAHSTCVVSTHDIAVRGPNGCIRCLRPKNPSLRDGSTGSVLHYAHVFRYPQNRTLFALSSHTAHLQLSIWAPCGVENVSYSSSHECMHTKRN